MVEHLAGRNWTLGALRDAALQAGWVRPSRDKLSDRGSLIRSLFSHKMYKAAQWRGPARQCRTLCFLLRYYVHLVEERYGSTAETRSFAALHACVR